MKETISRVIYQKKCDNEMWFSIFKTTESRTVHGNSLVRPHPGNSVVITDPVKKHNPRYNEYVTTSAVPLQINSPDTPDTTKLYLAGVFQKTPLARNVVRMSQHPDILDILSRKDHTELLPLVARNREKVDEAFRIFEEYAEKKTTVLDYFVELGIRPWSEAVLKKIARFIQQKSEFGDTSDRLQPEEIDLVLDFLRDRDNLLDLVSAGLSHDQVMEFARAVGAGEKDCKGVELLAKLWEYCHEDGHMFFRVDKGMSLEGEDYLLSRKKIVRDGDDVYMTEFYRHESTTAAMMTEFFETRSVAVAAVDDASSLLDEKQQGAVRHALRSPISIINGGPGTGKTFTIREITRRIGGRVLLLAPTGQAVHMIRNALSSECDDESARFMTIHKCIHETMKNGATEECALDTISTVIIDETSMMSQSLLYQLMHVIMPRARITRLLFIGDAQQLPSVDPGCVFDQMIRSGRFPVTTLTRVYRQKEANNALSLACEAIRGARLPSREYDESFRVAPYSSDTVSKLARETAAPEMLFLSPAKNNHDEIREIVRHAWNPLTSEEEYFYKFRVGDEVMYLENNYEKNLFNGMRGRVVARGEDGVCDILFIDGRMVPLSDKEMTEDVELAYVNTVHKAQGSESKTVVVILQGWLSKRFDRSCILTAISRAKEKCIVLGERDWLDRMIRKTPTPRLSNFALRLQK